MLNFPISYLFLKLGFGPEVTVIVAIVISQLCLFARLYMLKKTIDFPVKQFLARVYVNILKVTVVSGAVASTLMIIGEGSWIGFVFRVTVCVLCAGLSVFFIGCSRAERQEMVQMVLRRIRR
jgi:uncharacterized membrane protein